MQFQVPQFIETEDKIIGPLTIRQFLYLAVAGLLVFFSFFILQTWLWLLVTAVFGSIALALSFVQVNGRPMLFFAINAFTYVWEPHSYAYAEEVIAVTVPAAPSMPKLGAEALPPRPEVPAVPAPTAPMPAVTTPTPAAAPTFAPVTAAERVVSGGIKDLWGRLMTTKTAIPRREKPLAGEEKTQEEIKERYEIVRQITGEGELAKRVDYR
jgi:hypothetical protein